MPRYRIDVAYDGSAYSGWQVQPARRTVQGELERLLESMTGGRSVRVECSGRTDAGVHARRQVAHFDLEKPVDPSYFKRGLNAQLDPDVRVLAFRRTTRDFHARFSACGKEYRYFLYNGAVLPPWKRLYRLHERRSLDVEAMRGAADRLVGEHDFAPFSANPNREIDGTVRTIYALRVRRHGSEIVLAVRGNGFLYKMVRSLAGFLVRVGRGELPPEAAEEIFELGRRTAVVPTASPKGLFLWNVFYRPLSETPEKALPPRRGSG